MERNERRLTRRVLKTGPIGDLPLNLIDMIWREVRNAGRRARSALLRHIRVARIVNYWIWEWYSGVDMRAMFRLMNQMTQRWLDIGQASWTPRERRYLERRRYTQRYTQYLHFSPLLWGVNEQWGLGSR